MHNVDVIKEAIHRLPPIEVDGRSHLPYQAVTDIVAAVLFPNLLPAAIDEAAYRQILETAGAVCGELGYGETIKLTPPAVPLADAGLHWVTTAVTPAEAAPVMVIAGPTTAEMLAEGALLDARLGRLGLDEVTRQHFKIPVTASEAVVDLLHRAVAAGWPNDYRGIWHDICGMCITGGRDISPTERLFIVIIRGVGQQRYWRFKARLDHDGRGAPFLHISLADEERSPALFELGHVVMTPGVAALPVDLKPFLARHAAGDWGDLDDFDKRQNDIAVKEGYRILSAYDVPVGNGETERIWIVTEADRSVTTALLPEDY